MESTNLGGWRSFTPMKWVRRVTLTIAVVFLGTGILVAARDNGAYRQAILYVLISLSLGVVMSQMIEDRRGRNRASAYFAAVLAFLALVLVVTRK